MVEGIAATEIAKLVIDLGVTATLLILFVMHFLRKDKDSDKKVTAAMRTAGGRLRPPTGMHRRK